MSGEDDDGDDAYEDDFEKDAFENGEVDEAHPSYPEEGNSENHHNQNQECVFLDSSSRKVSFTPGRYQDVGADTVDDGLKSVRTPSLKFNFSFGDTEGVQEEGNGDLDEFIAALDRRCRSRVPTPRLVKRSDDTDADIGWDKPQESEDPVNVNHCNGELLYSERLIADRSRELEGSSVEDLTDNQVNSIRKGSLGYGRADCHNEMNVNGSGEDLNYSLDFDFECPARQVDLSATDKDPAEVGEGSKISSERNHAYAYGADNYTTHDVGGIGNVAYHEREHGATPKFNEFLVETDSGIDDKYLLSDKYCATSFKYAETMAANDEEDDDENINDFIMSMDLSAAVAADDTNQLSADYTTDSHDPRGPDRTDVSENELHAILDEIEPEHSLEEPPGSSHQLRSPFICDDELIDRTCDPPDTPDEYEDDNFEGSEESLAAVRGNEPDSDGLCQQSIDDAGAHGRPNSTSELVVAASIPDLSVSATRPVIEELNAVIREGSFTPSSARDNSDNFEQVTVESNADAVNEPRAELFLPSHTDTADEDNPDIIFSRIQQLQDQLKHVKVQPGMVPAGTEVSTSGARKTDKGIRTTVNNGSSGSKHRNLMKDGPGIYELRGRKRESTYFNVEELSEREEATAVAAAAEKYRRRSGPRTKGRRPDRRPQTAESSDEDDDDALMKLLDSIDGHKPQEPQTREDEATGQSTGKSNRPSVRRSRPLEPREQRESRGSQARMSRLAPLPKWRPKARSSVIDRTVPANQTKFCQDIPEIDVGVAGEHNYSHGEERKPASVFTPCQPFSPTDSNPHSSRNRRNNGSSPSTHWDSEAKRVFPIKNVIRKDPYRIIDQPEVAEVIKLPRRPPVPPSRTKPKRMLLPFVKSHRVRGEYAYSAKDGLFSTFEKSFAIENRRETYLVQALQRRLEAITEREYVREGIERERAFEEAVNKRRKRIQKNGGFMGEDAKRENWLMMRNMILQAESATELEAIRSKISPRSPRYVAANAVIRRGANTAPHHHIEQGPPHINAAVPQDKDLVNSELGGQQHSPVYRHHEQNLPPVAVVRPAVPRRPDVPAPVIIGPGQGTFEGRRHRISNERVKPQPSPQKKKPQYPHAVSTAISGEDHLQQRHLQEMAVALSQELQSLQQQHILGIQEQLHAESASDEYNDVADDDSGDFQAIKPADLSLFSDLDDMDDDVHSMCSHDNAEDIDEGQQSHASFTSTASDIPGNSLTSQHMSARQPPQRQPMHDLSASSVSLDRNESNFSYTNYDLHSSCSSTKEFLISSVAEAEECDFEDSRPEVRRQVDADSTDNNVNGGGNSDAGPDGDIALIKDIYYTNGSSAGASAGGLRHTIMSPKLNAPAGNHTQQNQREEQSDVATDIAVEGYDDDFEQD
jgi:hypothetical protein